MTEGEYWLLETVVEYRVTLAHLVHPDIESFFNKPGHNLTRQALVRTLQIHFSAGNLIAFQEDRGPLVPTPQELEQALHWPPPNRGGAALLYGLTPKGGSLWESLAMPEWNRYIAYEASTDDNWETELVELTCADRLLAQRYIAGLPYVGVEILGVPEGCQQVAPWEATYWKTLRTAHRFRFRSRSRDDMADSSRVPDWFMDLLRWYTRPELDPSPPGTA